MTPREMLLNNTAIWISLRNEPWISLRNADVVDIVRYYTNAINNWRFTRYELSIKFLSIFILFISILNSDPKFIFNTNIRNTHGVACCELYLVILNNKYTLYIYNYRKSVKETYAQHNNKISHQKTDIIPHASLISTLP